MKSKVRKIADLPWSSISTRIDGDDGIIELEEVEGVDVVYNDGVPTFHVAETTASKPQPSTSTRPDLPSLPDPPESMSAWAELGLHPALLHSLPSATPTPIQSAVLPPAMASSILATAPTGSGKTLAFALPILHSLLTTRPESYTPQALILLPTRELALQVVQHIKSACTAVNGKSPTPVVSVAAIVGGMSSQKQDRILARGVHIVVGTPGRLWDVIQTNETLKEQLGSLRFLVLDEADRLVQPGSFKEVERILECTTAAQTFVFSATMSQQGLQRTKHKRKTDDSMLPSLLALLPGFDPTVLTLSAPSSPLPPTLTHTLLPVLADTRDLTLYTLLLLHPTLRILIFLPSIPHIRRLLPLLTTLGLPAYPLHSSLPQPTRLSSLASFTKHTNAILLATDLAARGLDFDACPVDLVISYTPAPSPSTHIHRLGRTARAGRSGAAITVVSPADASAAQVLWRQFGEPQRYEGIPPLLVDKVRPRVQLAKQLEEMTHKAKKERHDQKWMRDTAEALGVDYDGEEQEAQSQSGNVQALKAKLAALLAKPLVPRGVSLRYPTAQMANDVINGRTLDGVVGVLK
ncbi:DEAD-domain-containing protein [Hymenopellis radicata]|nr:DEAD-domain-containing protein [Hymenopellis radicata]